MGAIEATSRIKVNWPAIRQRNKGCFCVERDYQFPGGFYIRHKDTPYFLTASRHDIECLLENALAALGQNAGPIIVPTRDQAAMIDMLIKPTMETLDIHLPGANGWYLDLLWKVLRAVKIHSRAPNISGGQQDAVNGPAGRESGM